MARIIEKKNYIYFCWYLRLQDGDLGFVIIIDRRSDKWTAVKAVFLKIAVSKSPPHFIPLKNTKFALSAFYVF